MSAASSDPGALRYLVEGNALILKVADFSIRQTKPLLNTVGDEVEKHIKAPQKHNKTLRMTCGRLQRRRCLNQ